MKGVKQEWFPMGTLLVDSRNTVLEVTVAICKIVTLAGWGSEGSERFEKMDELMLNGLTNANNPVAHAKVSYVNSKHGISSNQLWKTIDKEY